MAVRVHIRHQESFIVGDGTGFTEHDGRYMRVTNDAGKVVGLFNADTILGCTFEPEGEAAAGAADDD